MRTMLCLVMAAVLAAGCSAVAVTEPPDSAPAGTAAAVPATAAPPSAPATLAEPMASADPAGLATLPEGPLKPGRYAVVIQPTTCEDAGPSCPAGSTQPEPLDLELTVPDGWEGFPGFSALFPYPPRLRTEDAARDGAIVMGWTNIYVGLNSDPCAPPGTDGHLITDIRVGPTVDDFVNAVLAHPTLDVTEPVDVELGGSQGKFFTLTGPADISKCDDWRPWDPGFYVQGPDNTWDVWVMDVDGFRVLIATQYFPDTPDEVKAELRAMAESIVFAP